MSFGNGAGLLVMFGRLPVDTWRMVSALVDTSRTGTLGRWESTRWRECRLGMSFYVNLALDGPLVWQSHIFTELKDSFYLVKSLVLDCEGLAWCCNLLPVAQVLFPLCPLRTPCLNCKEVEWKGERWIVEVEGALSSAWQGSSSHQAAGRAFSSMPSNGPLFHTCHPFLPPPKNFRTT